MKIFYLSGLLALSLQLIGCQSFQFVESPIPVTSHLASISDIPPTK